MGEAIDALSLRSVSVSLCLVCTVGLGLPLANPEAHRISCVYRKLVDVKLSKKPIMMGFNRELCKMDDNKCYKALNQKNRSPAKGIRGVSSVSQRGRVGIPSAEILSNVGVRR